MRTVVKGLVVWLLASLPVGIIAGTLVSALVPADAAVDRGTAAFNGAMTGASLALMGGVAAMATTTVARGTLTRVGGSECLTGAIVTYGFMGVGLLLLLVL